MSPAMVDAHYRLGRQRRLRRHPGRGLRRGRPGGFRPRAADRHRQRDDADGLRHRAAAPPRGGLQGDHEPGVPGAARARAASCWRSSRRPTPPSATASTRHGSTSSWPIRSTPRRWLRSGACCPACSPTPVRWRWTPRRWTATLRQPGRRTRLRHRGPVPRLGPQGCRGAVALAGRRALRAAGLPALPGQRRPVLGRSVQSLGVLRLRTDVLPQLTDQRRSAGAGAGHHAQLPALRRPPVHRGGPRTIAGGDGGRAPLRRPVHRRRHERQCA